MSLSKSYLYVSMFVLNVLVVCTTLLIWYYFTDFSVEADTSPYIPTDTKVVNENNVEKIQWLVDTITKHGSVARICTMDKTSCDYEIPPMQMYQINSIVETLQLKKWTGSDTLLEPFKINYYGWFEYKGKNYAISMNAFEDYTNHLIYGVTSSVIGTLLIIFIWKKLQYGTTSQTKITKANNHG